MRGRALVIAASRYTDPELPELSSVAADAAGIEEVLADPRIGDFAVTVCLDIPVRECLEKVDDFFSDASKDDLLLLYLSGHGIKDEDGRLYFATTDTRRSRLRSTAIPAAFIHDAANGSKSQRMLMILDSCFSGAFASRHLKGIHDAVRLDEHFRDSTGRVVITASDAIQYAQAGEQTQPSLFSRHLIQGLRTGQADRDNNGYVSTKELYEHIFEQVRAETPGQRPQRWEFGLTGDLIVAANPRIAKKATLLPAHVTALMEHPLAEMRLLAVEQLQQLLNQGAPLSAEAREALTRLGEDDSRKVSTRAASFLPEASPPQKHSTPQKHLVLGHRPGDCFKDGEGPDLVVIPPGRFQMGSPWNESGRIYNEGPAHEVTIAYPFAVGKFPVTRGEWRRYVEATGAKGTRWQKPGFAQDDTHPVVCITWQEAIDYTAWLSTQTGHRYRLLSEAEHEYVNRAGSTTAYFWGDSADDLASYANGDVKAVKTVHPHTSPVGRFKPNAFGVFDTTGNVWCWTQDCYNKTYGGAPSDGRPWMAGDCSLRVVRGGAWISQPRLLRAAARVGFNATGADGFQGFRVAMTDF